MWIAVALDPQRSSKWSLLTTSTTHLRVSAKPLWVEHPERPPLDSIWSPSTSPLNLKDL